MNIPTQTVDTYLTRLTSIIGQLHNTYDVREHGEYIYAIAPKAPAGGAPRASHKPVDLTISALIHGVEVAGLAVVVELLTLVTSGFLRLNINLGVSLGNLGAAHAGKRFVERDLNRSFGRSEASTLEDRRAKELEKLFGQSKVLLDIHQVKLFCDRPFWIFPFTRAGFDFARTVGGDVSLITHWGKGFSADGKCSDEWVNSKGGVGVTIELGQNGFDPTQIARGVEICKRAIAVVSGPPGVGDSKTEKAPIYTWAEIVPYPETGQPVLDAGWHNFKFVSAGDRIGRFEGRDILAGVSGPVLFPKYPDPLPGGGYGATKPAAELLRIMREIKESELPG
jgi:succinylglutamate desuccinylase